MKITKEVLKRIIKEEYQRLLEGDVIDAASRFSQNHRSVTQEPSAEEKPIDVTDLNRARVEKQRKDYAEQSIVKGVELVEKFKKAQTEFAKATKEAKATIHDVEKEKILREKQVLRDNTVKDILSDAGLSFSSNKEEAFKRVYGDDMIIKNDVEIQRYKAALNTYTLIEKRIREEQRADYSKILKRHFAGRDRESLRKQKQLDVDDGK